MSENHLALAQSKILLDTREQFGHAIRDAVSARLGPSNNSISRYALDPVIDDGIYALNRDGPAKIEDNVRALVDDVARVALDASRRADRDIG
jgi:hypothetical protein